MLVCSCMANDSILKNTNGHAEVVLDSTVYRINFPALNSAIILNKNIKYIFDSFDISPSSKDILIAANPLSGDEALILLSSDGLYLRSLISKKFIRNPAYSPEGKLIAFLSSEDRSDDSYIPNWYVYTIGVNDGVAKKVFSIPVSPYTPSWDPSGKQIFVTSKDRSIYSVDIISGNYSKIIEYGLAPTVSNSGSYIAYLSSTVNDDQKKLLKEYVNMTSDEYVLAMKDKIKSKKISEIEELQNNNSIIIYDRKIKKSTILTERLSLEDRVLWSPDDNYLIYNDEKRLNRDIYVIDIETGKTELVSTINGKIMTWDK